MNKYFQLFLILLFVVMAVQVQNEFVAQVAKTLEFKGTWRITNEQQQVNQLKPGCLLKTYNDAIDYPANSGYKIADSKTFARIIVNAECGYLMPAGYDYAKHPIEQAKAGYILQKSEPRPHTMIIVGVHKEMVKVLHTNWGAFHRLSYSCFPKKWLKTMGFKVFKPGTDQVLVSEEPALDDKKYPKEEMQQRWGSWRVDVYQEVPYHRVCQGTIISHSGPGGQIRVNETREVSNTFSANCGVKVEVVTASVGFSVTASFSRALQFWKDVGEGKYGYVDLYYKYMVKKFRVYYKPLIGSEYLAGSGEAWKFQAVEFQYRETSN